jgi:ATP-binding cassette subfamily B (MDR/TAP) protein 1
MFLLEKYDKLLEEPNKKGVTNAHLSGILYGYSEFARFGFIAAVFYIGMVLIVNKGYDPENVFTGIMILFMAAIGAGFAFSQAPSMSKAKDAAKSIFAIIDEPSLIDVRDNKGHTDIKKGEIELNTVEFRYPSRS